jgi:hypothetical protein
MRLWKGGPGSEALFLFYSPQVDREPVTLWILIFWAVLELILLSFALEKTIE